MNVKYFPIAVALKFPIALYGKVRFISTAGEIMLNTPIRFGAITIGKNTDRFALEGKGCLINFGGTIIFNGDCSFSSDVTLEVHNGAILEVGNGVGIGSNVRIRCFKSIIFKDFVRIGIDSQVYDSNFHYIQNVNNNEVFERHGEIRIGSYNWIGNRVTVMKGAVTPNYCIVSSNSLIQRDYQREIPEYSVIGGIPAKLIKAGYCRIFSNKDEGEINKYFDEHKNLKSFIYEGHE